MALGGQGRKWPPTEAAKTNAAPKKKSGPFEPLFLFLWARMPQTIVAEIRPGRRVVGLVTLGAIGRIGAARYHGAGVPVVTGVPVVVAGVPVVVVIIIISVVVAVIVGVIVAPVAIT
jgi:hypothetical protein